MTARALPVPPRDDDDVVEWVDLHLGDLATPVATADSPDRMRGGQQEADAALQSFDVRGYARLRNNVWPISTRGSSRLSPYIRHGLLTLREVWKHVATGPRDDVSKFRDELLWQEYARHLYARMGTATRSSLRYVVDEHSRADSVSDVNHPWISSALCLDSTWTELIEDGWLTNQTRMWMASQWNVREGLGWRDGEDLMFSHLLDGSRAANRLGWQWSVGALTGKAYGFSRWQVEKRAPGMCGRCPLEQACPITDWPAVQERDPRASTDPRLRRDEDLAATSGPAGVEQHEEPEAVWLTAESLSDRDPASAVFTELPIIFVFDEPLLSRLRLSANRLRFLSESLADLASRRDVQVWRGDPVEVLRGKRLATTFAPVPGWKSRAAHLDITSLHPWPWLERPRAGSVTSYTAWVKGRR